jgi:hypothetical protein
LLDIFIPLVAVFELFFKGFTLSPIALAVGQAGLSGLRRVALLCGVSIKTKQLR